MSKKRRGRDTGFLPFLLLAVLFILGGVTMEVKNQVAVGFSSRTKQFTAVGGYLLIFIGSVFLIVSYYSLSPNSKIREFFEGRISVRNRNKRSKQ